MIPGKIYKPEDVVEAAWRRRWCIVVPFVVVAASTIAISQVLPDRYRSSALLLIVPQRVPETYVRPTVTTRLDERLQSIGQEIMSRTRLERIVQEFNLYPKERRRLIMDDVIELMREDIDLSLPRGRYETGSFTVSFEYGDARTAMLVAERLASLFIRENIEDRTVLADMTDEFLQSQLAEAERQLKDREKKLEAFRRANPGLMPAQMETNQQALSNAQMQLQALQESLNRDRDQQIMVQRQIEDLSAAVPGAPAPAADTQRGTPAPTTAARALENARAQLKVIEMRLKPEHPDIRAAKRTIKDLEQKATAEALEQPFSSAAQGLSPAENARAARLAELKLIDETLQRRIAQKQEDEKHLLATMSTYRQRLEAAPTVEAQLTELMRDYTTLQTSYQNLLAKSQEAKVAANLERRQIGEQFKIIDAARLPLRPTSPKRLQLNLLGALAGLVVGLALAALLEYRDSSLRTEDDVVVALSLPVVALVPTMMTAADRQRRKRKRLVLASSGAVTAAVSVALLAWNFRAIADWLR